eukprot:3092910-Alexandrium_andersonii.AAC.1
MSASLVGSEMCIRDSLLRSGSPPWRAGRTAPPGGPPAPLGARPGRPGHGPRLSCSGPLGT